MSPFHSLPTLRPLALAATLLWSLAAAAETPIDQRRPLAADGQLHVSNVSGAISVSAWNREEVEIGGMLGDGVETLDISGDRKRLDVIVRNPDKRRDTGDTTLVIKVPAGASLNLEAVSADIDVEHVRGAVSATSVSGDVQLDLRSPQVTARTVSGDIRLRAPSTQTRLNTVSGDIQAGGLSGQLALQTVSGDASVEAGGAFSDLQLKSISGDLDVQVTLAPGARVVGETLSGDLSLRLPRPSSARFTVNTFSGSFHNAYGGDSGDSGDAKGRHELRFGDGKAQIELSSFSGDVTLGD